MNDSSEIYGSRYVLQTQRLVHAAPTTGKTEFVKWLTAYGGWAADGDVALEVLAPQWVREQGWRDRSALGTEQADRIGAVFALQVAAMMDGLYCPVVFSNLWDAVYRQLQKMSQTLFTGPYAEDGSAHVVFESTGVEARVRNPAETLWHLATSEAGLGDERFLDWTLRLSVMRDEPEEVVRLAAVRGDSLPLSTARMWNRHLDASRVRFKDVLRLHSPQSYASIEAALKEGWYDWSHIHPSTGVLLAARALGDDVDHDDLKRRFAAQGSAYFTGSVPSADGGDSRTGTAVRFTLDAVHPHSTLYLSDVVGFRYGLSFDGLHWESVMRKLYYANPRTATLFESRPGHR